MAFHGCHFCFDGIPDFEYGLMIYDVGGSEEDGKFSSVEIQEDRTTRRYSPLHYGIVQNEPLTFPFTFGADIDAIDKHQHLDRWEMDAIANWLTGHNEYKWLEITQSDMEIIRYKCIITDLKYISYGNIPWAFTCTVTCDSPFAYMHPETMVFNVPDNINTIIECRAAVKYYFPKIIINMKKGSSFSIINHSDNDRVFKFDDIPASIKQITIDNENEIITNSSELNLYDKFNFNFFRLIKGYNNLEFTGFADVLFECEFPINAGG